jgi:hypothetical protein
VIEPEHRIADFVKAGADILSVHPESTLQLAAVIHKIQETGVAPGVVLNPATPIASVEHVMNDCRITVVMLVRRKKSQPAEGNLDTNVSESLCVAHFLLIFYFFISLGESGIRWTKVYRYGDW